MDSVYSRVAENNVVWHNGFVNRVDRNEAYGHKSGLIWFTGLSSSGKSTIAHAFEKRLFEEGIKCYVLDGDNIRHGLNADLGFSENDKRENLRRTVEVARLMVDAGLIVLAAFVSPFRRDRQYIRERFKNDNFLEVYVRCSVDECARRVPKGYYEKTRAGIIKGYTGVDSPYEEPENPDLILDTEKMDKESSISLLYETLMNRGWIG
ncbi:adenylyl-sulfate kinase [Thermodesulfovibrio sp. 3462-1]|uniref:Adenylyl-sulfate kinase n=1 Tax=Thermodesulfovibrio obliviosus TaxID=3118332 RepID=A0AAU8H2A8_9BACT